MAEATTPNDTYRLKAKMIPQPRREHSPEQPTVTRSGSGESAEIG